MNKLQEIKSKLDEYFKVCELDNDPQMGMFVPMVYERLNLRWETLFEQDFVFRKNGLMLRGYEDVGTIFIGVFPTPDVMQKFVENASPGDLFFSHHAIYTTNGDPRGELGNGWQPLAISLLEEIKSKGLSYYCCHSPMDYHPHVGTRAAMLQALEAVFIEDFFFDTAGPHGAICVIPPIKVKDLRVKLQSIFNIPYLDEGGFIDNDRYIFKVAIIAGGADNVEYQKLAEEKGVQAYICGEFNSNFDTEWARGNQLLVEEFKATTSMTMFGVSHAASEFLTMKNQMLLWFTAQFPNIKLNLIEQEHWWF